MAVWLALLVYLAATIGGLLYAVLRAILLWRRLKRTGRAFRAEASRIANSTETIETHLARASAAGGRLGDASHRLATSRATLEVQLQALREARHTVRRLLWFVPGI